MAFTAEASRGPHDRLENRVIIRGHLVLESALHIGTGRALFHTDAPVMRDPEGRPFIPGSSLKGALRAAIERIGVNIDNLDPPDWVGPAKWDACLSNHEDAERTFRTRLREERGFNRLAEWRKAVCPACRLFGSPVSASKVRVRDLPVREPWLGELELRDGVAIDRDTETARDQRKFDYEAVPAQTQFELEIVAENLDQAEQCLLAIGLHELSAGLVRLGGRVSRGLGACRFYPEAVRAERFDSAQELADYLARLVNPTTALETLVPFEEWIAASVKPFRRGEPSNAQATAE